MKLLRFPYLVQKEILEEMGLYEAVLLSTTSKKSRVLVKCCLKFQRLGIEYHITHIHHSVKLTRKSSAGNPDKMIVCDRFSDERRAGPSGTFLDLNVAVKHKSERSSIVYVHAQDATESIIKVYQYLVELFPRAGIKLKFAVSTGLVVTRIMKVAKVDEVYIRSSFHYSDDMAQSALNEPANTKKLWIMGKSFGVWINSKSRFELDYLYIKECDWFNREKLVRNFLNCKKVILPSTLFGFHSEEISEFVKSWMRGSRMELLKIGGRWIDRHYGIADTVGILPGAVEVRRVRVWEDKEESEDRVFAAGCCYMVRQSDGTKGIVSWSPEEYMLATKFELLEDRDGDNKHLE